VLKLLISAVLLVRESLRSADAEADGSRAAEEGGAEHRSLLLRPRAALAAVAAVLRPQLERRLLLNKAGLAVLYCFNNQLAFALFTWADAASITLVKSASSIVSALLLWAALGRPIGALQWLCISLQVLGLFIVQYDSCKGAPLLPPTVYVALVVGMLCSCSAGVWNEWVLKNLRATMYVTLPRRGTTMRALAADTTPFLYACSLQAPAELLSLPVRRVAEPGRLRCQPGLAGRAWAVAARCLLSRLSRVRGGHHSGPGAAGPGCDGRAARLSRARGRR
jgi:hypothetical protein